MTLKIAVDENGKVRTKGRGVLTDCCCDTAPYFECGCCFPTDPGESECMNYPNPGGREACEAAGGVPYVVTVPGIPDEDLVCVPCNNDVQHIVTAFGQYGITVGPGDISLLSVDCRPPTLPCPVCPDLQPFPSFVKLELGGGIRLLVTDETSGCNSCPPSSGPICQFPGSCYQPMREYYTAMTNAVLGVLGSARLDRQPNNPCCWSFFATLTLPEEPTCVVPHMTDAGEDPVLVATIYADYCVNPCGPTLGIGWQLGGWAEEITCFQNFGSWNYTPPGMPPDGVCPDSNDCQGCDIDNERLTTLAQDPEGPGTIITDDIEIASGGTFGWSLNPNGTENPLRAIIAAC